MIISSSQSKSFKKLKRIKKGKDDFFLVEGIRGIDELARTGVKVDTIVYSEAYEGARYTSEEELTLAKPLFAELSDVVSSQGIIAVVRKAEKDFTNGPIVLLDRIQDPGNLGTILRTAQAFGINNIIALAGTVDIYNEKVIRSSLGAVVSLSIKRMNETEALALIDKGYEFVVADLDGQKFDTVDYNEKFVLVLGNEANGPSEILIENSAVKVTIPMRGEMESLNVAVAGSIIMYEMSKFLK